MATTGNYQQSEDIWWAVKAALVASPGGLADMVQQVSDRRNAEGNFYVDMPSPARIVIGYDDPRTIQALTEYPRVHIVGAPRTSSGSTGATEGDRVSMPIHTLYIQWFVVAGDRETATVLATRYGEAILKVLMNATPFSGWMPSTQTPQVNEIAVSGIQFNNLSTQLDGYLSGGSIPMPLKGRYTL